MLALRQRQCEGYKKRVRLDPDNLSQFRLLTVVGSGFSDTEATD